MNNITETMEGLNIGTKQQYRAAMVDTLLNSNAEIKERELNNLRCFIFKSLADFIQVPYKDFKLTAISAWENDETHIRHLSCNDFNGTALIKNHYSHGKKTMTHGYPWQPGLRNGSITQSEKGTKDHNWGEDNLDDVLDWLIDAIMTFYFGPPSNGSPCVTSATKLEKQRHEIVRLLGVDYNCAMFIYDSFEVAGCSGFGNEGAVGELRLNEDGSKFTAKHFGGAYVPEPELHIESVAHRHLNENVYI